MSKFNRTWLKMSSICFLIAVICRLGYAFIGSEIGPDGVLHEPFYLIPIGWLAIFLTPIFLLIAYLRKGK